MPISEAADFLAESECLHAALLGRDAATLLRPTQFKGWSIEDVLVHLHFWNHAAEQSATDPVGFARLAEAVRAELNAGRSLRGIEDQRIAARGQGLLAIWIDLARGLAARWAGMDSKARLPWVGPSMSARSSITARQMETWAHGFEVFDALGLARAEGDRIRNIVVLGVNTFGWSHQVHGLPVPPRHASAAASRTVRYRLGVRRGSGRSNRGHGNGFRRRRDADPGVGGYYAPHPRRGGGDLDGACTMFRRATVAAATVRQSLPDCARLRIYCHDGGGKVSVR